MKQTYNQIEYDINPEYSFKDFTNRSHQHLENISGVVYRSCFSNDNPDAHIFPDTMTGVTFIYCNLDNVFIPAGNTVIDCSQKKFKAQNDLNDWLIDDKGKPTMPINHKAFTKQGLPVPKPADIPLVKGEKVVDLLEVAKLNVIEII